MDARNALVPAALLLLASACMTPPQTSGRAPSQPTAALLGAHAHPTARVPRVSRTYVRPVAPTVARPSSPLPVKARKPRPGGLHPGGHWWAPTSWTLAMQRCIRAHESGSRYDAISPSGTFTGAYQFSDATWTWASRLPGRARDYPPAVQDAAFLRLFNNGVGRHQWSTYPTCRAYYGGPA